MLWKWCSQDKMSLLSPGWSNKFYSSQWQKVLLERNWWEIALGHWPYVLLWNSNSVCVQRWVCNFCIYTFAESGIESAMHIESLHKLWTNCVKKAKWFYRTCLLLELMRSWLTCPFVVDSTEGHSAQASEGSAVCPASDSQLDIQPTYCYCGGPEVGRMLEEN